MMRGQRQHWVTWEGHLAHFQSETLNLRLGQTLQNIFCWWSAFSCAWLRSRGCRWWGRGPPSTPPGRSPAPSGCSGPPELWRRYRDSPLGSSARSSSRWWGWCPPDPRHWSSAGPCWTLFGSWTSCPTSCPRTRGTPWWWLSSRTRRAPRADGCSAQTKMIEKYHIM